MKARVVHIITKLELGGAQQNTLFTVSHLDRDLFEPILISGEEGILDEEAGALGIEFHQVPAMIRQVRPHKDLAALWTLARMLRSVRRREPRLPTIVHTHSSKAGILGRWAAFFARCEIIIHSYHGFGFTDWQRPPVRAAFVMAERITRPITDAFICVSQANIDRGRDAKVLRDRDTLLIRSGIDIGEFSSEGRDTASIRRELAIPEDAPLVGMVACFKPQKSPLDFIEIAARVIAKIPEARFIMAGDGELRPEIEARIEELGIGGQVKLLGWRRDIPDLLAAMDVLVLTSLFEGLPRVIPQAMAASRPVVATRVDGSPEALRDGVTGYAFEPHDVETAATKVAEILLDPATGEKMGVKGRRFVAEFDIHKMVRDQEDLYLKLLG